MNRFRISHSWRTIRGMRIRITHRKGSAGSRICLPGKAGLPPQSCEQGKPSHSAHRTLGQPIPLKRIVGIPACAS